MKFLEFPKSKISMVYGASATGKTTLCIQLALDMAKEKKVLFIDTEGGFSTERIKQMSSDFEKLLDNIIIFRVKDFDQQISFLENIEKVLQKKDFGLVIIDTLGMHYRKALQDGKPTEVNQSVISNMRKLKHLADDFNIPVILTNQIYTNMEGENKHIGGSMVKGFAKYIVELKKEPRKACVIKPEEKECFFEIDDSGLIFSF